MSQILNGVELHYEKIVEAWRVEPLPTWWGQSKLKNIILKSKYLINYVNNVILKNPLISASMVNVWKSCLKFNKLFLYLIFLPSTSSLVKFNSSVKQLKWFACHLILPLKAPRKIRKGIMV